MTEAAASGDAASLTETFPLAWTLTISCLPLTLDVNVLVAPKTAALARVVPSSPFGHPDRL